MPRKSTANTRGKIVSAAWKLFYEQGYEDTTVEDIIEISGTSKGSFYHYFDGKDALLSTLSTLFDEKYEALQQTFTPEMGAMDRLLYLNEELFALIEDNVPVELLARMLSTQLHTNGEKHLLDRSRTYYKLLRRIIIAGQESGELTRERSAGELVRQYAMCERALMYDWCLYGGEYSLKHYSGQLLPDFLSGFLAKKEKV